MNIGIGIEIKTWQVMTVIDSKHIPKSKFLIAKGRGSIVEASARAFPALAAKFWDMLQKAFAMDLRPLKRLASLVFLLLAAAGCQKKVKPDIPPQTSLPVVTASTNTEHETPTPSPEPQSYAEYHATLDIFPKERKIIGVEKVIYVNSTGDELSELRFNAYLAAYAKDSTQKPYPPEAVKKVMRYGEDYSQLKIGELSVNEEHVETELTGTSLRVILKRPLSPGERIEVRFEIEAYIPAINARTGGSPGQIWCGNFFPMLAVYENGEWRSDPCYNVGDPFYTRTSNFTVSVTAPLEYEIIGTGSSKVAEHVEKKTTTFTAKLVRDFAFAVSADYKEHVRQTSEGVDIDFYAFSDLEKPEGILDMAERALAYFGDLAGPYPYNRLVLVEAGLPYYNAMEYSQLIFLDSDFLNEAEQYSDIAHEIGHQWFYNIIGSDQVNNAWMDEGLVAFLKDGMFLTREEQELAARSEHERIKAISPEISGSALSSSLGEYKNWAEYHDIQFGKGKLLFHSLRNKMGDSSFLAFLKLYYQTYSFKIASPQNMIDAASAASGMELDEFFNGWIYNRDMPELVLDPIVQAN
ncbi:MAG: M1 family metallopeptidase [Clostridiales bacterium]|nr:M1 family metallopeptidase [Clostridiales bacterium]